MKQTIRPTTLSIIVCVLIIAILIGFMYYYGEPWMVIPILVVLLIIGMYYRLMFVTADDNGLSINRFLRTTKIPMSEISSVKEHPHPKGMARIFGGGSIWGNSGWFQIPGEGKCFVYIDNPKDCILVTLKNGKKYLLACDNPAQMVENINAHIK